ncbi:hypothetical protein K432DRAFT_20335 [Lepidopterella palustris CBS 459.81]|uniref:Uncharacterized protein n=1 Tax=Lepidopterella palustris CBS 459.81 TaxID=1314670 RepID=A0A8E2ECM2_9PEZI|nr:hypothetical protein K432DRAFT_20335 [Lepidopterella palustris CBS 459.81]
MPQRYYHCFYFLESHSIVRANRHNPVKVLENPHPRCTWRWKQFRHVGQYLLLIGISAFVDLSKSGIIICTWRLHAGWRSEPLRPHLQPGTAAFAA